jgi:hypothetical protein
MGLDEDKQKYNRIRARFGLSILSLLLTVSQARVREIAAQYINTSQGIQKQNPNLVSMIVLKVIFINFSIDRCTDTELKAVEEISYLQRFKYGWPARAMLSKFLLNRSSRDPCYRESRESSSEDKLEYQKGGFGGGRGGNRQIPSVVEDGLDLDPRSKKRKSGDSSLKEDERPASKTVTKVRWQ